MVERHVPEDIPAIFFGESVVWAANAGGHATFRGEIPAQDGPFPAFSPHSQFPDKRSFLLNRKHRAKCLTGFAVPSNEERILVHARLEARQRPVLAEIAIQRGATGDCYRRGGQ